MSNSGSEKIQSAEDTEMLEEYDFNSPDVVQGKTYQRL